MSFSPLLNCELFSKSIGLLLFIFPRNIFFMSVWGRREESNYLQTGLYDEIQQNMKLGREDGYLPSINGTEHNYTAGYSHQHPDVFKTNVQYSKSSNAYRLKTTFRSALKRSPSV